MAELARKRGGTRKPAITRPERVRQRSCFLLWSGSHAAAALASLLAPLLELFTTIVVLWLSPCLPACSLLSQSTSPAAGAHHVFFSSPPPRHSVFACAIMAFLHRMTSLQRVVSFQDDSLAATDEPQSCSSRSSSPGADCLSSRTGWLKKKTTWSTWKEVYVVVKGGLMLEYKKDGVRP